MHGPVLNRRLLRPVSLLLNLRRRVPLRSLLVGLLHSQLRSPPVSQARSLADSRPHNPLHNQLQNPALNQLINPVCSLLLRPQRSPAGYQVCNPQLSRLAFRRCSPVDLPVLSLLSNPHHSQVLNHLQSRAHSLVNSLRVNQALFRPGNLPCSPPLHLRRSQRFGPRLHRADSRLCSRVRSLARSLQRSLRGNHLRSLPLSQVGDLLGHLLHNLLHSRRLDPPLHHPLSPAHSQRLRLRRVPLQFRPHSQACSQLRSLAPSPLESRQVSRRFVHQ